MSKRTSILFQSVHIDRTIVTIEDNEHYGEMHLTFETIEQAEQCYKDTVAILTESYSKLTEAGWGQADYWDQTEPEEQIYGASLADDQ